MGIAFRYFIIFVLFMSVVAVLYKDVATNCRKEITCPDVAVVATAPLCRASSLRWRSACDKKIKPHPLSGLGSIIMDYS